MSETKNNLEAKARFFALYYGQKVCEYQDLINNTRTNHITDFSSHRISESLLSLRSIESLTDEEIRKCHKLMQFSGDTKTIDMKEMLATITMGMKMGALWQICSDYLRSIGILIPWMDLSVEELISRGWAKLKKD